MKYPERFDNIRRFYDEEVAQMLPQIRKMPEIGGILQIVLGKDYAEYLLRNLGPVNTVDDFQREVIGVLVTAIEHKTCKDVQLLGTENYDLEHGNLFVSNHRDIVLDSALLNSHLFYKGLPTTQIAIGNNLLAYPWITAAVRMNKAFVVKRDGSVKEQFIISKELSEYIRMVRTEYNESIWIAQREGRAKNSDDRTAPAIIKMLTMSGARDMAASLEELNITPLSINYEFDPCDYLKAREFQLKRDMPDYKKSQQEDLLNMKTGIMGYKGRVVFVIGKPLSNLKAVCGDAPRNEQAELIAEALDKEIFKGYHLFPINYVAADMLEGGTRFACNYTAADVKAVEKYLASRIELIDIPGKDEAFLKGKILEMYGNPALNQDKIGDAVNR